MTATDPRHISGALRACARGVYPLEAGTSLLIDCGSWLHRDDFTSRFITAGPSISDGVTLLASIDWETAVADAGAGSDEPAGEVVAVQPAAAVDEQAGAGFEGVDAAGAGA